MQKKTVIFGLAVASLFVWIAVARAAVLESPAKGATLSGLGFISGWKCDATKITVTIDDGDPLPVAMHQERGDLRAAGACGGTINHGFIMQLNWALLGAGAHVVVAYDDGVEFARHTFSVGTTGEEFLKDVARRTVLEDFPTPGKQALLEWNESTQHFEIVTVWGELPEYDQAYWRQFTAALAEGTYREAAFLYAEEPDVDACFAGRLTQAAKNRALEAMNQIRALHGVPPVQYSSRYDEQVQAAALIQAAAGYPGHYPEPSARCYTPAGAEGSRTSSLGVRLDPAAAMVAWTNDAFNRSRVAAAGHRRWVLNPFAAYMSYGQVNGYAAQKVFGFDEEPSITPRIAVDYVAFPYETYPFHLVEDDPPWSFSVVEDKSRLWGNAHPYFDTTTVSVTRVSDGASLIISNRYTDSEGFGIPNFLSWQVEEWDYDTPYEVEIRNVAMQSGETRHFSYQVFVEHGNLEE